MNKENIEVNFMGLDVSVVKILDGTCRGPKFSSQNPYPLAHSISYL